MTAIYFLLFLSVDYHQTVFAFLSTLLKLLFTHHTKDLHTFPPRIDFTFQEHHPEFPLRNIKAIKSIVPDVSESTASSGVDV